MKVITTQLTDDQYAALEAYAKLPQHQDWIFDEVTKQNVPAPRFSDGAAVIDACVAATIKAAMESCPPASVKALLDQKAALEAQIAAAGKATTSAK